MFPGLDMDIYRDLLDVPKLLPSTHSDVGLFPYLCSPTETLSFFLQDLVCFFCDLERGLRGSTFDIGLSKRLILRRLLTFRRRLIYTYTLAVREISMLASNEISHACDGWAILHPWEQAGPSKFPPLRYPRGTGGTQSFQPPRHPGDWVISRGGVLTRH